MAVSDYGAARDRDKNRNGYRKKQEERRACRQNLPRRTKTSIKAKGVSQDMTSSRLGEGWRGYQEHVHLREIKAASPMAFPGGKRKGEARQTRVDWTMDGRR